ncbi:MAG: F0F1 ATP synthase subunit A [Actinomycetota bacterium]
MSYLLAAGKAFEAPDAGHLFNYDPLFKIGSISVTYPMLVLVGITLLLIAFFVGAFRSAKVVPVGAQNVGEAGIEFVEKQIAFPVLGSITPSWLPYITAVFFWVFFLNLMEIVPGVQFPITSRMAIPATLAALAWLIYNAVGIKNQGFFGYFRNMLFPPGVPKWVYIFLTPIEFFSTLIFRPLTLALRLFANMVAGHMLLTVIASATSVFLAGNIIGKIGFVIPGVFGVIMTGFELFVAFMQAFIISVLTAVYIAGAQEAHH